MNYTAVIRLSDEVPALPPSRSPGAHRRQAWWDKYDDRQPRVTPVKGAGVQQRCERYFQRIERKNPPMMKAKPMPTFTIALRSFMRGTWDPAT